MKWFKFYGQDWLTDLKIMQMSLEDRVCFITLLCLASAAEEGGLVRNCSEEALIELSHIRPDPYDDDNPYTRAKGCLERYAALHCVTLHDNGDVTVVNFDRRQGENLSNAERQKRYRERLKITPKPRHIRNVTPRNDSNARIDKNRVDKSIHTESDGDGFETSFWNPYPKKVGKADALKSWKKLHPTAELREKIAQSISRQSASEQWRREGGRFIPNPATWLNQGRWDDEIGTTITKINRYG